MTTKKKTWRHLDNVDCGLPDSWLERVNSLSHWKVGSSCEGHCRPLCPLEYDHALLALEPRPEHGPSSFEIIWKPHVNLALLCSTAFESPNTAYTLVAQRDGEERRIQGTVPVPATDGVCDSDDGISTLIDAHLSDRTGCILNLHHTIQRETVALPKSTLSWLDDIAERIENFNKGFALLIHC